MAKETDLARAREEAERRAGRLAAERRMTKAKQRLAKAWAQRMVTAIAWRAAEEALAAIEADPTTEVEWQAGQDAEAKAGHLETAWKLAVTEEAEAEAEHKAATAKAKKLAADAADAAAHAALTDDL